MSTLVRQHDCICIRFVYCFDSTRQLRRVHAFRSLPLGVTVLTGALLPEESSMSLLEGRLHNVLQCEFRLQICVHLPVFERDRQTAFSASRDATAPGCQTSG